jgi:hypothetical protein
MPYCENCGTQVNPDSKFCRNCGAAQNKSPNTTPSLTIQSPQTQNPMPISPSPQSLLIQPPIQQPAIQNQPQIPLLASGSETTLGIVIFRKPKSLGRYDTYTGVMTSQRLIFARLTDAMIAEAANQARNQAKAEGKGFWGQWSNQLKASFGYAKKYLVMPPDAIIAETPGNFALNNNTIIEIKVKPKFGQEDVPVQMLKVEIHSTSGKFEFEIEENSEYVKQLRQIYGERVKTPLGYFNKTINLKF